MQLQKEDLARVEGAIAPAKGLLTQFGWVFLANDTNNFLSYFWGIERWTQNEKDCALEVLKQRSSHLNGRGIPYRKFIIPEKVAIYSEYLPEPLRSAEPFSKRPARMLSGNIPEYVSYLEPHLSASKPYGPLYFRGDTHPNWLGSWFIYHNVVSWLVSIGLATVRSAIGLWEMKAEIIGYDGDIYHQANQEYRAFWEASNAHLKGDYPFEQVIRYSLPTALSQAQCVQRDNTIGGTKLLYRRMDGRGATAVIFRDSTSDYLCDLLAEHFARTVFVWKNGEAFLDVIEEENPDVVIHIMAERFVTSYPLRKPFECYSST